MIIPVKLNSSYDIVLERGAINNLSMNLDRKVLIITDVGVPSVYSETVAKQCKEPFIVKVKQGEESKSFEVYKSLLEKMLEFGFTRNDAVVAVGGGVVGDLSGFVAASYMRGVDFYNIPTTLLSQVDSSIGGKVAINLNSCKNIVGAFYQPKQVVIDPDVLKTLPLRQLSNGLSESVKMALTFNEELFQVFEDSDPLENLDYIIEQSLLIKKRVVEEDEKEKGLRKVLNFGHTIGHGIESSNFSELYHGECVALGMIPMCSDEIKPRLIKVLEKLSLPTTIQIGEQVLMAMLHDKKMNEETVSAVFVKEVGAFEIISKTPNELYSLAKETF